jgi:lipoprotein-releasing system permease protein
MPYELFLALRYFYARRRRPLARVTALLAIAGIASGVGALIVALALANGFRDELRDKILRGTAHLNVSRADGQPLQDYPEIVERIRKVAGVTSAAATTYDGAVLSGPNGSAYAVLRGVDQDSAPARLDLRRTLIAGSVDPLFEPSAPSANEPRELKLPRVIIGADLARHTGLQIGAVAEIIPANASLATLTPVYRHVEVAGIFRSGLFEYDSTWVYLPLDTAAAFAGTSRAASVISVEVRDIYDVKSVAANVRAALGNNYTTIDWQEANRQLFNALALERRMGICIIALIIFVAAINITTTLILVVVERQYDIAILGAMGATARSIMSIFVIEGAVIGAAGAAIGVAVGTIACLVGNHYHLVSLPADVYSVSNVPFNSHPRDVLVAALAAFFLSLLATIYPASAAASVRPVEMLRER